MSLKRILKEYDYSREDYRILKRDMKVVILLYRDEKTIVIKKGEKIKWSREDGWNDKYTYQGHPILSDFEYIEKYI